MYGSGVPSPHPRPSMMCRSVWQPGAADLHDDISGPPMAALYLVDHRLV
jgi:hypothetical protein